jgi:hypothetical protein
MRFRNIEAGKGTRLYLWRLEGIVTRLYPQSSFFSFGVVRGMIAFSTNLVKPLDTNGIPPE